MKVSSLCTCVLLVLSVCVEITSTWKPPAAPTVAAFGGNLELTDEIPYISSKKERDMFFCPERCACSVQEKIIDCSSMGLDRVPQVPKHTSRLYLHSNRIEALEPTAFSKLHNLTYLILSGNDINAVPVDSFKELTSLKYLILDSNNISSLPEGIFSNLRQLETISLAKNALNFLLGGLFSSNNQVTLLNLQGNQLKRIDDGAFDGLSQLSTLNLDDNFLDKAVFEELNGHSHLSTLRLNNNQIESLPPAGLSLPALKHLWLSSNQIPSLPAPLMTICSLETMMLNHNQIGGLESGTFRGCGNLTKLDLRENAIASLPPKIFSGLTSLKNLYLHKNNISNVPRGLFKQLPSIQAIHLEWNQLTGLSPGSFVDLPSLDTLYLHHNELSELEPGTFVNLIKLRNLDLHSNRLTSLKPGVLSVLHSLQKVQLDLLECSCDFLHLATWSKRHHIRGITCRGEEGRATSVHTLGKLCSLKQNNNPTPKEPHEVTPPSDSATLTTKDATPLHEARVRGPQKLQERETTMRRLNDVPIMTVPRGPIVHKPSAERVMLKLDEIQHSIIQLQFRLAHVETILDKVVGARKRQVCIHEGARLEVGDQWMSGRSFCSCSEAGSVECSLVGQG